MKLKLLFALAASAILAPSQSLLAADSEEGFVQLFDGKTFNGWKKAEENPGTWKIEDGALVAHGDRCHLFYVGDDKPFKNFHLKVEVMTAPHSNGGIYFHPKYQPSDWPRAAFQCPDNNPPRHCKKTTNPYNY